MSSDKSSDTLVQRRTKHSDDEPLPREKLPESLQKIVDNEESLMEQIYDGTYVQCYPPYPYPGAFFDCCIEQTSLQIPTSDMQRMPLDSELSCSVRTATWPTPQT